MGKICTTDKKEALSTDKIYIDKEFYKYMAKKDKILKRCKYCKDIITHDKDNVIYYNKGYCSEWCYEMENPPDISHVCKTCGIVVNPWMRWQTTKEGRKYYVSTGRYPNYCEEHKRQWKRKGEQYEI